MTLKAAGTVGLSCALGVLLIGSPASGPLAEAVPCPDCEVQLDLQVRLGDSEGEGMIGGVMTVEVMPDGRYVLAFAESDAEFLVFSPDGAFLESVGRRGQGPGEFQFIRWLRTSGDHLHVIDPQLRRQTVLSADFRAVRTVPLRLPMEPLSDVLVLNDSTLLMNGHVRSGVAAGHLMHTIVGGGTLSASFGEDPDGVWPGRPPEVYFRSLAHALSGPELWVAHRTRYRIERWTRDGTLLDTFIRDVPWFPDHEGREGPWDPRRPPLPQILDVREDEIGRLWVLIRVPSEVWEDSLIRDPDRPLYRIGDINRAFDTIIEVIEPSSGRLLVSSRVGPSLFKFVGNDLIASAHDAGDGTTRLHLWSPSLRSEAQAPPPPEDPGRTQHE